MPNLAIQKMHAFLKNNSICNIQTLFEVCYSLRSNMFNFFLRILPRMPRPWRWCLALRAKRPQAVVTSSTHKKKWMCTIAKEQARARGENANAQTRNNSSDLKERSHLFDVLARLRWSPPDGQSETEFYWILICGRWGRSHFCSPQARTEIKAFEGGAAHVAWSKQNSPKANFGP